MHLVEGFTVRKVLDEWIAVPGGESAARISGLFSMNETSAFLFDLLQVEQTEESLLRSLLDEFCVDEETGRRDVRLFLDYLRENNILVEDVK